MTGVPRRRSQLRKSEASQAHAPRAHTPDHPVLDLQRSAGNVAVTQQLIAREAKAPKQEAPKEELPAGAATVTFEGLGAVQALSFTIRPDVVITANTNELSPKLQAAAAAGRPFATVVVKGHGFTMTMKDVYISNYQIGGGENPIESYTLNFKESEIAFDEEKEPPPGKSW